MKIINYLWAGSVWGSQPSFLYGYISHWLGFHVSSLFIYSFILEEGGTQFYWLAITYGGGISYTRRSKGATEIPKPGSNKKLIKSSYNQDKEINEINNATWEFLDNPKKRYQSYV